MSEFASDVSLACGYLISSLRNNRQADGVYEIAYPDNWRAYPNDTPGALQTFHDRAEEGR